MTTIQNPTPWSDYDFLEFECFVSKVGIEGFSYAAEHYGPEFENAELQKVTDDLGTLRAFYREHFPKVGAWYEMVGGERACDLHNAHVDEARKREEDSCLFGVRCTDGHVITYRTAPARDTHAQYLLENRGKGWREPAVMLRRLVPGGEWTEERAA
ncbi:hypothetical protein ACFVSX_32395 [Streptomyces rubiginosohelvolus]|uniref:hypothetical protein n=1 Tax=Streptomyces rubiginosohelvolus TaxID=67362 RepID=UPI0036DBDD68